MSVLLEKSVRYMEMEESQEEDSKSNFGPKIALETLGENQLKLSGTSFILRDFDQKFVYKVIKTHSATEAVFYSIVYRICIPRLNDFRVNNINPDVFENISYLVDNELIPNFYGITSISYEDHRWYDLGHVTDVSANTFKAIKLENLMHGFENPGVIDIKLGSHNVNDDIILILHLLYLPICNMNWLECYGEIDDKIKVKSVELWRELKSKYHKSVQDATLKSPPDFNASDLGLPESYNKLDMHTLFMLIKTWRQKQVALETTEQELGFRITSIYIQHPDKNYVITSNEAKNLTKTQTIDLLSNIFKKDERMEMIRLNLIGFIERLSEWISLQKSISIVASSILIIFDVNNPNLHRIKWIDFTHINHNSTPTTVSLYSQYFTS
ncbi:uncharacterized protein TA18720 [Theileria annulata]|uniref:Kinase n=1 Tax=Theileria annulata TaxID=5874 RepID=Q4UBE4_THEAN|nr:uncharacterized protein TA18720 [Theileria annulata]CAI75857.1 hypothetical protein TA18720 [Theileria annulata]|eukprot:XP_955333.1 hypothetical protein TA18720 [Theileria annulata]